MVSVRGPQTNKIKPLAVSFVMLTVAVMKRLGVIRGPDRSINELAFEVNAAASSVLGSRLQLAFLGRRTHAKSHV